MSKLKPQNLILIACAVLGILITIFFTTPLHKLFQSKKQSMEDMIAPHDWFCVNISSEDNYPINSFQRNEIDSLQKYLDTCHLNQNATIHFYTLNSQTGLSWYSMESYDNGRIENGGKWNGDLRNLYEPLISEREGSCWVLDESLTN